MKKFFGILLILFAFSGFTNSAEPVGDVNWQKVADNNYIDYEGIVGTEDMYGFTFLLKSYNKGQYEAVNGNDISYTLAQYTINCTKMTYKIGLIDSYGYKDNFVTGDYNKYAKFQPIVQDTAVSAVAAKLCRP